MLFRWCMEDVFSSLESVARGCGPQVGDCCLTHIRWAVGTLLLANSAAEPDWLVGSVERAARRVAGLELRLSKCTWARFQRRGVKMPELSVPYGQVCECASYGRTSGGNVPAGARGVNSNERKARGII